MLTKALHKLNTAVDKVYMTLAAVLFIVLIIASTLQVFTRYVLNNSMVGTEELARYCFVWMSLLGGSIAVGRWAHTSITILYDRLSGTPKKCLFCVYNLLIITLALIFIIGGITMMKVSFTQATPTLHIPKWLIYLAVPLSGTGMCLHALEHISGSVGEIVSGKGKSEKEALS